MRCASRGTVILALFEVAPALGHRPPASSSSKRRSFPNFHCDAVATEQSQVRVYPKAKVLNTLRADPLPRDIVSVPDGPSSLRPAATSRGHEGSLRQRPGDALSRSPRRTGRAHGGPCAVSFRTSRANWASLARRSIGPSQAWSGQVRSNVQEPRSSSSDRSASEANPRATGLPQRSASPDGKRRASLPPASRTRL
jgi:hypothetical protein